MGPIVPRARVGLATQGFSVLRSTDELPRHFLVALGDQWTELRLSRTRGYVFERVHEHSQAQRLPARKRRLCHSSARVRWVCSISNRTRLVKRRSDPNTIEVLTLKRFMSESSAAGPWACGAPPEQSPMHPSPDDTAMAHPGASGTPAKHRDTPVEG